MLGATAITFIAIYLHFAYRRSLLTWFILLFIAERVYESYYTHRRQTDNPEKDRYLLAIIATFTLMVLMAVVEFYLLRRPIHPAWMMTGFALLVTSALLRWSTITVVGGDWAIETYAIPEGIQRDGPYHLFRHPYYIGVFLEALSFPLILNAWYALIFSVLVVAPLEGYRAFLEERILAEEFGWIYIRFKREVNRFLPTLIKRTVYDRRNRNAEVANERRNDKDRRFREARPPPGGDRRRIIRG